MQILNAKRDPKIIVTKRVIYRHHDDVMVISAGPNYANMMRTQSAPPNIDVALAASIIEFENENKARTFKTNDGLIITQEMLDDFEDSSSEEDKESIKNDELVKEEVILNKETNDNLEKIKQEAIDEKLANEIESISIDIKEQIKSNSEVVEESENNIVFEIKSDSKIDKDIKESVIINAEDVECKPVKAKEPVKIYIPPFLKPENNLDGLVNSGEEIEEGEIIVGNLPITHNQNGKTSVQSIFKSNDRSFNLKFSHKPTTSILTGNNNSCKYSVNYILLYKERKQVHIRLDRSIFKKSGSKIVRGIRSSGKNNKSSRGNILTNSLFGCKQKQGSTGEYSGSKNIVSVAVESALSNLTMIDAFRLEMNRVTIKTVNDSIKMMEELVINTQDEMKEIVNILFEKVIGVSIFMDAYFKVIKSAYKTFRSIEEKEKIENDSKCDKTTYFFSRICELCKNEFVNRESWSYNMGVQNLEGLTKEERFSYEDALEWNEVLKNKKKQRVMGCVKFISRLYDEDMINETLIILVAKDLISKSDDVENLETLCVLLTECGKKFREKSKKIFDEVLENIKSIQHSVDNRLRYKIQELFEMIIEWDKAKARELECNLQKNKWFGLVKNTANEIENEKLENEEYENREELETIVKKIMIDVLESDYDNENIMKRIDNYLLRFSTKEFLEVYLLEMLEQRGDVDKKTAFLIEILGNKKMYLKEALKIASESLSDLVYDAPHCYKQFAETLCILSVNSFVSRDEIVAYENEEMLEVRKKFIQTLIEAKNIDALNKIADKSEANDVFDGMVSKEDLKKFDIIIDYFKGS